MSRREQMIKSIKEGNSVLIYDGVGGFKQYTIANIEQLPSDAELALGNASEEKKALASIEEQFAQLEAAKKKLVESQKSAAKAETDTVEVSAEKAVKKTKKTSKATKTEEVSVAE